MLDAFGIPQNCTNTGTVLLEPGKFGRIFDRHAKLREAVGQQTFVAVLERNMPAAPAVGPEVESRRGVSVLERRFGQIKLTVEFERAGLHGKRARRDAGFASFVDNAYADLLLRQPERQYQPCRAGSADQDFGIGCRHGSIELPLYNLYEGGRGSVTLPLGLTRYSYLDR